MAVVVLLSVRGSAGVDWVAGADAGPRPPLAGGVWA